MTHPEPPEAGAPSPRDEREPTLFGEDRGAWEAHLARMHGAAWVEASRGFLDAEWAHLLERWGDERDLDSPARPAARPDSPV